jgi:hypothetical protein
MALTNSVEAEHNKILRHVPFVIIKVPSFLSFRKLALTNARLEENEPTSY